MIIIAIVRICLGISHKKTADNIMWELFWLSTEAVIAVIMFSVTAFRSLLGIKAQKKAREKRERSRPLVRYFKKTPQNDMAMLENNICRYKSIERFFL